MNTGTNHVEGGEGKKTREASGVKSFPSKAAAEVKAFDLPESTWPPSPPTFFSPRNRSSQISHLHLHKGEQHPSTRQDG